jgi:hypothetical protein
MMKNERPSVTSGVRYVHECMFSLNLASAIIASVFLDGPTSVVSALFRMEISVQRVLHIHQTDLHLGYWAFFLPATALALCIWLLLRLTSNTRLAREMLRSIAAFAALALPAVYWLCARYEERRRYGWNPLQAIQTYELLAALVLLSLYLANKRPIPLWSSALIVVLHFSFWFWQFGPYSLLLGFGGPVVLEPVIGLSSALAWLLYTRHPESG